MFEEHSMTRHEIIDELRKANESMDWLLKHLDQTQTRLKLLTSVLIEDQNYDYQKDSDEYDEEMSLGGQPYRRGK